MQQAARPFWGLARQFGGNALLARGAACHPGAEGAGWVFRGADGGAKVEQRLGEIARGGGG